MWSPLVTSQFATYYLLSTVFHLLLSFLRRQESIFPYTKNGP